MILWKMCTQEDAGVSTVSTHLTQRDGDLIVRVTMTMLVGSDIAHFGLTVQ